MMMILTVTLLVPVVRTRTQTCLSGSASEPHPQLLYLSCTCKKNLVSRLDKERQFLECEVLSPISIQSFCLDRTSAFSRFLPIRIHVDRISLLRMLLLQQSIVSPEKAAFPCVHELHMLL